MKKLIVLLLFIPLVSFGQSLEYGNEISAIKICNAMQGNNFLSDEEANNALDKILNAIGASKRFVLQPCNNIKNAVALTFKGVRYIMYDPNFMKSISNGDNWANTFILAHEVGHHINGHSVDAVLYANDVVSKVPLSTKRVQELEADEFAGFILGRLGAKLSDAMAFTSKFPDGDDTYSTHPKRSKRIASITKGFKESGGSKDKNEDWFDSKYSNRSFSTKDLKSVLSTTAVPNALYEGYVNKFGTPSGYGIIKYNNGMTYEGEIVNGKYNGFGTSTLSEGSYQKGFFINNNFIRGEQYVKPKGVKAIGKFIDGFYLEGDGQVVYDDGKIIDGFFKREVIIKGKHITEKDTIEIGFLDNSKGNGISSYTDEYGGVTTAVRKDGVFVRERGFYFGEDGYSQYGRYEKKYKKAVRRVYLKNGIKHLDKITGYIPENIYRNLEFKAKIGVYTSPYRTDSKGEYDHLCYGEEKNKKGQIVYKGYHLSGSRGLRFGYGEYYGNDLENKEIDYYKGMWWDNNLNGYGIMKFKNGKINKGIFNGGVFVKAEDFDLDDMQTLLKYW